MEIVAQILHSSIIFQYILFSILPLPFTVGNKLQGTIPTEIGNLRNLEILEVGNNRFTGTIPTEAGLISDYLKILHFGTS